MPRLPDPRRLDRLAATRAAARQRQARARQAPELTRRRMAAWLREYLRRTASYGNILAGFFPPADAGPALDRALEIARAAARLLEALGDSPQMRREDDALLAGLYAGPPFAELVAAVKPYYAGKPLDRDGASVIELVAWCLFKHGKVRLGEVIGWPDGTQSTVAVVP
jgi:hypothetical protein